MKINLQNRGFSLFKYNDWYVSSASVICMLIDVIIIVMAIEI